MKRFLIPINTGLGNAVLLLPLIRTIKSIYKDAEIDLIGDNKYGANDLFEYDIDIDGVYTSRPNKKYDIVFNPFLGGGWFFGLKMKLIRFSSTVISHNFQVHSLKDKVKHLLYSLFRLPRVELDLTKHESVNYLNLLTPMGINDTQFKYSELTCLKLLNRLNDITKNYTLPDQYITIQLGAANNDLNPKIWPIKKWLDVIEQGLGLGLKIVLIGDKNEMSLGQEIESQYEGIVNLIGKTSILELMGVINNAQLTVGVDSGIAHISGVLNKKTIVLWGPSIFSKSHPLGDHVHYINLNMPCSPCMGPGLFSPSDAIKNCQYNIACMNDISAEQVVEKIKKVLNENN